MSVQTDQFSTYVTEALRLISRLNASEAFVGNKITISDWLMLRQVAANADSRQSTLANRIGVTRQRATQIVKRLRARGLIEVDSVEQATKSRTVTIRATTEGARLLDQVEFSIAEALGAEEEKVSGMLDRATKGSRIISRRFAPGEARTDA